MKTIEKWKSQALAKKKENVYGGISDMYTQINA